MSAIVATTPKALWYLTRGTGTVSFLLLTAAVLMGIAHSVRWSPARTPRFVVQDLHRNISLLVIVFVAIHVATAVIDGFAPIRWLDAVVPFTSAYRAVWLGLGAVALDVLLAVAITSLLRPRLGFRIWKGIHGSAYACWVVAIFHGLGVGSDARQTWMLALAAGSVIAVVAATCWRVALGWSDWTPPGSRSRRGPSRCRWRWRPSSCWDRCGRGGRARRARPHGSSLRRVTLPGRPSGPFRWSFPHRRTSWERTI